MDRDVIYVWICLLSIIALSIICAVFDVGGGGSYQPSFHSIGGNMQYF